MPTKAEIIGAAVAIGLGEPKKLTATFEGWQQKGLLGKSTGRLATHEGVWPPIQQQFFVTFLQARREPLRLSIPTLAQNVVAHWMKGTEGVDVGQAQRAFETVLRSEHAAEKHRGPESAHARTLRRNAATFASPGVTKRQRSKLFRVLELAVDLIPVGMIPRDHWIAEWKASLGPVNEDDSFAVAVRDHDAFTSYRYVELHKSVWDHLDELTSNRSDTRELWEWARQFALSEWEIYRRVQPGLATLPAIGHMHAAQATDDAAFAEAATDWLVVAFGVAIRWLSGTGGTPEEEWEEPPQHGLLQKASPGSGP